MPVAEICRKAGFSQATYFNMSAVSAYETDLAD
jgi:hypothetical protein